MKSLTGDGSMLFQFSSCRQQSLVRTKNENGPPVKRHSMICVEGGRCENRNRESQTKSQTPEGYDVEQEMALFTLFHSSNVAMMLPLSLSTIFINIHRSKINQDSR
jgi:hypothetical protein